MQPVLFGRKSRAETKQPYGSRSDERRQTAGVSAEAVREGHDSVAIRREDGEARRQRQRRTGRRK